MAIPQVRAVPIIIINTNKFNIWVRQPLLAAKLYDAECDKIEYRATMDWEGKEIKINFQPVLPLLIKNNSCQVVAGSIQSTSQKTERPEFGHRPDTGSTSFYFKSQICCLPFQLNTGKKPI